MLEAWRSTAQRRLTAAILVLGATGVVVFGALAPPEHCPAVTAAQVRRSAAEAVDWFVRNQQPDGRWLYLYEADSATVVPDYNVVRHVGAQMGLYQAATAGIPGAMEAADRGMAWSIQHIVQRPGWAAVRYGAQVPTGASALLVAGLAERRINTSDEKYDALLQDLGRFLAGQVAPSGAVRAYYDIRLNEPVPGQYSRYYSGETYWALVRLRRLFPAGPWTDAAGRVGTYLSTRRDDEEGYWPPLADHWAAYGLAETVAVHGQAGGQALTEQEVAYARRQAGLFGSQVRWISQQAGPWGRLVRGTHDLRGGGYGVIGEALTGLWLVSGSDRRLADLRGPLAARAACIAGLAVRAQTDATEAAGFAEPARVQGAWLRGGETRMDDQQHAMSALLRTAPIVAVGGGAGEDSGGSGAPSAWLWMAALVAAMNPFRLTSGLRRGDRSLDAAVRVTLFGGLAGAAVVLAVAVGGVAFLDAVNVSNPALRIAAGTVAAIVGAAALVRRPPSPEPALPGPWAALVPVAVPMVAGAAVVALAVGGYADRGAWPVVAGLAIGVGILALLSMGSRMVGVAARVLGWAARLTAAAAVVLAAQIVIAGVLAV